MDKHAEMTSVGIVGLGNFGRFVISHLSKDPDLQLLGYDSRRVRPPEGAEAATFDQAVDADIVVLAVPLGAYPRVLPRIAKRIRPETVLVDICSVKVEPAKQIEEHLPEHANLLMTHPLFGPQSAAESTRGHKLIVTQANGDRAQQVLSYCAERLGLDVQRMSASDHDKLMAKIHVLTFFVARGLARLNLDDVPFQTPSYSMITDLIKFDHSHTDDLFRTIQLGNPYADEIRQELMQALQVIESELIDE